MSSCNVKYVDTKKISNNEFIGNSFPIASKDGNGIGGWLWSANSDDPTQWRFSSSSDNKVTDVQPGSYSTSHVTCVDDNMGGISPREACARAFAFEGVDKFDNIDINNIQVDYHNPPTDFRCASGSNGYARCYKNNWNIRNKANCCTNQQYRGWDGWDCDPSWCPANESCQSVWQTDKYSEYLVNLNNTDFCNTNSDKNCKSIMDAASTFDKTFPDKSKDYQIAYINKNCTGDKLVSEPCKSKCFKQGYDCDSAYTSKCTDIYNAVSPGKNVGQIAEYINDNFPYCNCYLPSEFYRDYKNKILEDLPPSVKVLAKDVGDSPQECSYVYCATSSNYIPPSKSSYKCPDTQLCIANAKVNLDGGVVKAGHDISIANQNLNCKQGSYFSKQGSAHSNNNNGNGGNGDPDKDPGSPADSKKLTKTQIIVISVVGGISFLLLVILMFFMLR